MLAVWRNLPDPTPNVSPGSTTGIVVPERMWRKFVGKHVCNSREPWADVFGEATVKALAATPHGPFTEGAAAEATAEALAALEREIRKSLSRPLVLVYTSLRERGVDGQRWIIPMPSGAIAVVYVGAAEKSLVTCYFTGAASVDPIGTANSAFRARRWKTTVRELVREHAVFHLADRRFRLPHAGHRREKSIVGGQSEMCLGIRFIDPVIWGFASSTSGSDWTPPDWTWPALD